MVFSYRWGLGIDIYLFLLKFTVFQPDEFSMNDFSHSVLKICAKFKEAIVLFFLLKSAVLFKTDAELFLVSTKER